MDFTFVVFFSLFFFFSNIYLIKRKYLVGIATSGTVPLLTARGVIEGKKFIGKPPSNPAMAEHAKLQIAMHDSIFFFMFYFYFLIFNFIKI